ncbi:MAG: cobalamin biosynthesis protein P47K [Acetobacterium woodii]|nr:cobalamin biosynthesis protein P47K [Acetobacterium woodii]
MGTNSTAVKSEPMKIVILGGFLGSGKTSVLIQLLGYLAGQTLSDEIKSDQIKSEQIKSEQIKSEQIKSEQIKVAVIENEIGEIGVDNALVTGAGYTVKNLFAGCVCCTMAGDLVRSIERIQKDLAPEWLVVESTGVAYPKAMKEVIQTTFEIVPRICIIVDAKRWQRLLGPLQHLITGQLEEADTILINKTDLVSMEALEAIQTLVFGFNGSAVQIPICATLPIDASLLENVIRPQKNNYG